MFIFDSRGGEQTANKIPIFLGEGKGGEPNLGLSITGILFRKATI